MRDILGQKQAVAPDDQRFLGLLNFLKTILEEQTSAQLALNRIAQVIHRIIIQDVVSHYTLEPLVTWYMITDKP